jgi:peptidoglycan/xylan/chitin deacetylase (PgdA/CDA1 family)
MFTMSGFIRIPVLTYHSMNVSGNSYSTNDHMAFAADLALIRDRRIRVAPLADIVDALVADDLEALGPCVAITFDDGSNFDFYDLPHPTWGIQRSMFSILLDMHAAHPQFALEATSFVVVSPSARTELDRGCMIGRQWWSDEWWSAAEASERLRIESHSWDHNHEFLSSTATVAPRGTFDVRTDLDAEREIAAANAYLCDQRRRHAPTLFAYPYGRANAFLAEDYFPRGEAMHGVKAAFTTDGRAVLPGTNRWRIPRFVCGWHWKDTAELKEILDRSFSMTSVASGARDT